MTATENTQKPQEPKGTEEQLGRMSFGDHLEELRRRILRALAAIVLAIVILIPFKTQVQEVILGPYRQLWTGIYDEWIEQLESEEKLGDEAAAAAPEAEAEEARRAVFSADEESWLIWNRANYDIVVAGDYEYHHVIKAKSGMRMPYELVAIGGLEDFWMFMSASLIFALCLASPVVLWQIWAFIAAGLYSHERRVVYRHIPLAFVLLTSGILFGYFVVVPNGLYFLVRLMNMGQVQPMLAVSQYFSLLFAMTAALGIVFQLPLVMLALNKVGLVSLKGYIKRWRGTILGIWVAAALVTPPDPITQMMMAIPLLLLFGFGLILVRFAERKRAEIKAEPGEGAAGGGDAADETSETS